MKRNRKLIMVAALAAVVLLLSPMLGCGKTGGTGTTGEKPYYEGKTITIVVHAGAGGSTDIFHRVVARHMGKYIPGSPSIVVRNMTAGGGIVGSNYVYKAKPDGLTTLGTSVTAWTLNFLRPEGVDFKLADMPAILNSSEGAVIFVKPDMVKEPKDLLKDGLIFGTIGPTAGHGSGMLAVADLLEMKTLKWVWGYKGSAEERLAFFAGETNMFAASVATWNAMKTQAAAGEVAAIMQTGVLDSKGNVVRDPGIPDIKTVGEVYQELYGKAPSGPKWEAFKGIYVAARVAARSLYVPPGTPADIVKILDQAAHEMGKDPEYNAEYERLFGKGELFFPQEAPDVWKVITSPTAEVRDSAKRLVAPHGITLQ